MYAGLSWGVNSSCLRATGVVDDVAKSGRPVGEVGDGLAPSSDFELEEFSMGFSLFLQAASPSDDAVCCSFGSGLFAVSKDSSLTVGLG